MPSGYSTTGTPTNTNQMDWTQTAIGLGTGLIGMIGQNRRERRAMENQETLMGIQSRNQMKLNQHGADLQYDMWKKTNYPAQVEMLKEAGLNPGLIYGSAGAGGTTGSQGGGSAQGGNAPSPQPMDIQSALNVAMSKAQIELAKSQANKNEAEAEAIGGYKAEESGSKTKLNNQQAKALVQQVQESISKAKLNTEQGLTEASKRQLMKVTEGLQDAQTGQAIANTEISEKDLQWMKETGLNRNDGIIAKTIQYLSEQTGVEQGTIIWTLGGLTAVEKIIKLLPQKVMTDLLSKAPTVIRGLGKN